MKKFQIRKIKLHCNDRLYLFLQIASLLKFIYITNFTQCKYTLFSLFHNNNFCLISKLLFLFLHLKYYYHIFFPNERKKNFFFIYREYILFVTVFFYCLAKKLFRILFSDQSYLLFENNKIKYLEIFKEWFQDYKSQASMTPLGGAIFFIKTSVLISISIIN